MLQRPRKSIKVSLLVSVARYTIYRILWILGESRVRTIPLQKGRESTWQHCPLEFMLPFAPCRKHTGKQADTSHCALVQISAQQQQTGRMNI